MSRTIVQLITASELRAGDVIVNVHEDVRATVTDIIRGSAQESYWADDDTLMPHIRSEFSAWVTVTFAERSADIFHGSEPVLINPRPATIAVYRTRWVPEDDGQGGTTEPDYMHDTVEEIIEIGDGPDMIDDAILTLRDLGVFGNPENVSRYIDPDGSRTIDYATGEREEVSAELRDFDSYAEDRIRAIVGDAY